MEQIVLSPSPVDRPQGDPEALEGSKDELGSPWFDNPVLSVSRILRHALGEGRVEGPVLSETLVLRQTRDERRVEGPVLSETLVLRQTLDERRVEGLTASVWW
jgi:hypothetical protein